MSVKFSRNMACWTWSCLFGCSGFDFEGEEEAQRDFLNHACPMDS